MDQDIKQTVWLNCYDLSNGLAKQLSPIFLGKQIDGIWHTGIVVYGKEYFFGNGICWEDAGMTPFGEPTTSEDLGETEIPIEMFHDFLSDIKDRFTFQTYNIVSNNCNNFTNECANFLIGSQIPDYILNQAEEFFATPLGQQVKPIVMASQDALKQGTHSMFDTGSVDGTNQKPALNPDAILGAFSNMQGGGENKDDFISQKIIPIRDITILQEKIFGENNVVVYIWSPAIEECKNTNNEISNLADEFASESTEFYGINSQEVTEVAFNFDIKSLPWVYMYKQGDVVYDEQQFSSEKLKDSLKLITVESTE